MSDQNRNHKLDSLNSSIAPKKKPKSEPRLGRFPKGFLWGASVSTHQVEGGNHNQWTVWELDNARSNAAKAQYRFGHLPIWKDVKRPASTPSNYVSGKADDHYNRYREDFDIAKKLGLNCLRTGFEWSRIEPEEGEFDQDVIEHYRIYFKELKARGILPVYTLWHTSIPVWFAKKGGFVKRSNVKYFLRYVQMLVDEFGRDFKVVITINEPTIYSSFSYYLGEWPPEEKSAISLVRVSLNLAKAHRRAYRIIKNKNPGAKIGLAHNCSSNYAGDSRLVTRFITWGSHKLMNELFINLVKRKQDFLGLNYYFANRVRGFRFDNPNEVINDLGWDMQPDKLESLLNKLYRRYKKPIIITESGTADMHDQYRKWWIGESVMAIDRARKAGTRVAGYIHWSLLDNFEWAEGFWPRFGLTEVDYKTQKRTIRKSALWYAKLIKSLKG